MWLTFLGPYELKGEALFAFLRSTVHELNNFLSRVSLSQRKKFSFGTNL